MGSHLACYSIEALLGPNVHNRQIKNDGVIDFIIIIIIITIIVVVLGRRLIIESSFSDLDLTKTLGWYSHPIPISCVISAKTVKPKFCPPADKSDLTTFGSVLSNTHLKSVKNHNF